LNAATHHLSKAYRSFHGIGNFITIVLQTGITTIGPILNMPYEIDPDEMEAAINMAMLSPIPVVPKRSATDFLSASSSALAAASPHAIASPGWFTADQERQLLTTIGSDKVLITDVQRTEMSRLV
jgi:hypothetical protein